MDFEDQITQSLKTLSRKQLCQFAQLCGLRALPFLSVQRGFVYWREKEKQKHLYSIFYALDVSMQVFMRDSANARTAADNAARDAEAAIDASEAASEATYDARATIYATRACVYAYSFIYGGARAVDCATRAADCATRAADFASRAAARETDAHKFKKILLEDIEAIKKYPPDVCNHDTSEYDKVWDNFQEDLKAIGCGYWANFYEELFKNGFEIDQKKLKLHLGVPDEIKAEGAAAVGRYLEGLGDVVERLNEARIIILGEKGAGKTSLARKLYDINAPMPEEYESTEGVERHLWPFPDKNNVRNITAHIWDFAGHSITHSAHRCFMSARCLYIYVYNGRIERDNDPAYWLEQIRIHGGDNSPVLFLINEKDDHNVDIAEKTLKKKYPSIVGYYRVDIGGEDKTKLEEFRQTVMNMVRNNPSWSSQVVSAEAYKIKIKLREHFEKTKSPHITRDEFDEIAKNYGVQDERIEDILEDLHILGICLWYKKEDMEEFNMLVLNPDWITNGIYRIINKGNKERKYKLTVKNGTEILRDDTRYEYSTDNVAYLFRLMKVYELAFFKDKSNIFIPGILPIDMPDGLPTFDNANDRLTISFVVEESLPPSIVTRVIVQRNEFGEIFNENLLWRKGAVLKYQDGDATALVVEDARSVIVRVKGVNKTTYIASLRETIKRIFDSYQVIKPDLKYEVLLPEEAKASDSIRISEEQYKPLMLSEDVISDFINAQQPYRYRKMDIPLTETAQVYNIYNININSINMEIKEANIKNSLNKGSTINNSGTTVYKSPGTMVNSKKITLNLPSAVDKKQFSQVLAMLEEFLKSEQAKKLTDNDFKAAQTELAKAYEQGHKKGWERLRGFLSDAANIATIGTAISAFLAIHPEIPQTIISMFGD